VGIWRTTTPYSLTNGTRSTFWPISVAPPVRRPVIANVVHSGVGLLARITSARAWRIRSREIGMPEPRDMPSSSSHKNGVWSWIGRAYGAAAASTAARGQPVSRIT
jgi:hypothetical protein